MSLIKSNKCRFCNSKNIQKIKIDNSTKNFYVKAIISDLNLSINKFKSIKTYECKNCNLIFNNPWFKEEISRKIYSNVYGQHHNNWQNLINFVNKKILPDHGGLFSLLNQNIKIKNYAEYNSPFMGLFLNFFYKDIKNKKNIYKDLNENIIQYLSSRQLAGSSKKKKKQSIIKSRSYLLKINKFKKKYSNMHKIKNKILFYDQSYLNWGINDNFKSINSKAYAQEIFDLNLFDINFFNKKKKFDLIGIFHSLDHCDQPKKVLEKALKISDYVIIHCHDVSKSLNNQHSFGFTPQFFNNLIKRKIYTLDLTNKIGLNKQNELYILCSNEKKKLESFKKNINKKLN